MRRGFTIVELLVAAAILAMAAAFVHAIFAYLLGGATTEAWVADTNGRLAHLDATLRESLLRAGVASYMTVHDRVVPSDPAAYALRIRNPGEDTVATGTEPAGSLGTMVLSWIAVNPGVYGLEGRSDRKPSGRKMSLFLARGHRATSGEKAPLADLVLQESSLDFATSPSTDLFTTGRAGTELSKPTFGSPSERTVVGDLSKIRISKAGRMVTLEITCVDPLRSKRRVYKSIDVDTSVEEVAL